MSFPRFTIRDMVESQRRLVTQKLGIQHLHAIVGVSMGGMQTLQWGVSHPEMMDALTASSLVEAVARGPSSSTRP
jgi:homoserine O-acetyltransferase